jgi:orotate phosphoribosyltransferase
MARELSHSNTLSLSSDSDICVLTPEYNSNGQMVFRDNLQSMIWGKNVLLLIASATTGKTINRSLDCIAYYGGKTVGIAAIFSAIPEMLGQQIYSIFSADDLPDYQTFVPHDCPFCKEQRKIDAIVSSSGYTKIK